MTTVVTGSAGFIGRHVVAALLADGHDVVAIDRRPATTRLPGETQLVADLLDDDERVTTALREADAVVHLAGHAGVRDTARAADLARVRDNVLAGELVCSTVPADTPLVVASSSSVYGGARIRHGRLLPCHEDQVPSPRGAYARSKVALEQRCHRRAARGAHVAIVRPFTVAGEGQRPDMALATWIGQARAGRPMTVLGSPDRRRDVTDVHAVAHGILRLLQTQHRLTVNLGTGTTFTLGELTAAVAAALGVPHRTAVRPASTIEAAVTRADTSRCRTMLGFAPRSDLADLVRRQVAAIPTTALLEVS